MRQWREITSMDEWQEVLHQSTERPILIFKHSTSCPISAKAWQEFQSYLDGNPDNDTEYVMVKVIESRNVSNQIANDVYVTHKSPQLILLRNKRAVYDTSHWSITEENIRKALH